MMLAIGLYIGFGLGFVGISWAESQKGVWWRTLLAIFVWPFFFFVAAKRLR